MVIEELKFNAQLIILLFLFLEEIW